MSFKRLVPTAVILAALMLVVVIFQTAGQAQVPQADLVVDKSVDPSVIALDEIVVYSITLSNTTGVTLEVSSVVDVMPAGFEFAGMAYGSDVGEPVDNQEPEIVWESVMVPGSSILTLRYYVSVPSNVPLSDEPYINTAVATVGEDQYTAQAGLMVALGEASVQKMAEPDVPEPGATVTYTVAFSNSGYVPLHLAVVTDVLPSDVTFLTMTAGSDVLTAPAGVTGTIAWMGPYTIPAHSEFRVEYLAAMPTVSDTVYLENEAWGRLDDGTVVGPASEVVRISTGGPMTVTLPFVVRNWAAPAFFLSKSANPTQAYAEDPGALITYTVTFENQGTVPGVLADIRDTLPAGFVFVQMMPGSDVSALPTGTSGEIVWTGPFEVDGNASLTLIYQARASSQVGVHANSVTATPGEGLLLNAPATSLVELLEPVWLVEEFENPSPHWEPFLNYWRLKEEQWHLKPGGSDDGSTALAHTFWFGVSNPEKGAHDALYMYKDPAAEQWTDYSLKTRAILYFDDGTDRGQFGLWFRGHHQDHDEAGLWVTGYYFILKPGPPTRAYLMQLRTDEECGDDCNYNYHFSNPMVLEELDGSGLDALGVDINKGFWYDLRVEVDGPRIRCYFDDVLLFDYYDDFGSTFLDGTVGFFTYLAGDARFDHVRVEPLH